MQATVEWLLQSIQRRDTVQLVTVNPIMMMTALQDPDYMALLKRAELIVPDGTGVVWAAAHVKHPVAERVPGIDLVHRLMQLGEDYGWRFFLLGSDSDTIHEAARAVKERYPKLHIAGARDGYFTSEQDEEILAQIQHAQPHVLLVGRSAALQEPWMDRYKSRLDVPLMMGVGGSFDVMAGKLKRAPKLFQRLRLEWFYRLLQEPKRFGRMLSLPRFVWIVLRNKKRVLQ